MGKRKWILVTVGLLLVWHFEEILPLPTPGNIAPAEPDQVLLADGAVPPWQYKGCKIVPLATYSLKARVLHRDSYYFDTPAKVSPLDLALGWGRMSDPNVYRKLWIEQGWRWYIWWYWGEPPIPPDEISGSSANTHLIPADAWVEWNLYWLRPNDVVKLSGYLVEVDGLGGTPWRSSLTRSDTGDGACEIMWVKEAEKVGR